MKSITPVALGFVGMCSNAFGGIVLFSPAAVVIDRRDPIVDVTVAFTPDHASTGLTLDAFDVMFGSEHVPLTNFVFSDHILIGFPNRQVVSPGTVGVYAHEMYITANRGAPNVKPLPILPVGTLTLDLTDLPDGLYSVKVDPAKDFGLSALINRGVPEPLVGFLPIGIPEPASFSLFALVALGALRFGRRRSARKLEHLDKRH